MVDDQDMVVLAGIFRMWGVQAAAPTTGHMTTPASGILHLWWDESCLSSQRSAPQSSVERFILKDVNTTVTAVICDQGMSHKTRTSMRQDD